MARTKRGSKAPGFDYMSARPCSHGAAGKVTKVFTHRIERRNHKKVIRQELGYLD